MTGVAAVIRVLTVTPFRRYITLSMSGIQARQ